MIKGAIWDVDGTILDSTGIWLDVGKRYLISLGIQAEEGLGEKLHSFSLEEGVSYLKNTYPVSDSEEEIRDKILGIIRDFYCYEVQAKPGVIETLKLLKEKKIRMILATSGDKELVIRAFERLGILSYFEDILTCEDVGESKRSPKIFVEACHFLETLPEETLVFEDTLYALRSANKAGTFTVGVEDLASASENEEICREAKIYVDSLDLFLRSWSISGIEFEESEG